MHNQLDTLTRQHLADMRRTAERSHLAARATAGTRHTIPMALLVIVAASLVGFVFTGAA